MAEKKDTDAKKKKTTASKGTSSKATSKKKTTGGKTAAKKPAAAKEAAPKDVEVLGETLSHNDVSKENAERFSETEVKVVDMQEKQGEVKSDKKRYVFVARYDNIVLEEVRLNNLKCEVYKCIASSLEDAFDVYRKELAKISPDVDGLLRKVFGNRILVEIYDDLDVETDVIEL